MKTWGGNRGLVGIGTLIIFIAVVLVASVAAGILIYTVSPLQTRSLETTRQVDKGVSSGVQVISLLGTDGSAGKDIEHFELILKTMPGSDAVNLNTSVIVVKTKSTIQNLAYNHTAGNTATVAATTASFHAEWLKQGSEYQAGYLSRGDIVKLRFNSYGATASATTGGVGEDERVEISFIPKTGNPMLLIFYTPKPINDQREPMWPKESLL